jgi:hypothetical protein
MNAMILRARQMSLALLVVAVADHGHLQADYSGVEAAAEKHTHSVFGQAQRAADCLPSSTGAN